MIRYTATLLLICPLNLAFHVPRSYSKQSSSALSNDYLSNLSGGAQKAPAPASISSVGGYLDSLSNPSMTTPSVPALSESSPSFFHAPIPHFDIDKLKVKGPRANADVGEPYDASRKLGDFGVLRSGSWWCASGGWPSPKLRATTEIFTVLSGHGCLTDLDGMKHYFGPGDTVILPKGWSGRWDILEDIHKIWFVSEHPNIEESNPVRVRIVHYHKLPDELYSVGPVQVTSKRWTTGTFPLNTQDTAEGFYIFEGSLDITDSSTGSLQQCVAGDTLLLPKGFSGQVNVRSPVKTLTVNAK